MDWPKFVKKLLLSEGRINENQAEIIELAVMDEGQVDREEIEFLAELKREAVWVHPRYDELLFKVLKRVVLRDGVINDAEARWLRKLLYADRQIVEIEKEFLKQLKREAKRCGQEFQKLYKECTQLTEDHFYD